LHDNIVVPRHPDLLGNIEDLLFQAVSAGNTPDEWSQNVKPGSQSAAVSAEFFNHLGALLRDHDPGVRDRGQGDAEENNEDLRMCT
jgi:hypothetical protein